MQSSLSHQFFENLGKLYHILFGVEQSEEDQKLVVVCARSMGWNATSQHNSDFSVIVGQLNLKTTGHHG